MQNNITAVLLFIFISLSENNGKNAASLTIAEQYVKGFSNLARTNNTLIIPSNVSDVSSLVGQAMSIYKTITNDNDDRTTFPEKKV